MVYHVVIGQQPMSIKSSNITKAWKGKWRLPCRYGKVVLRNYRCLWFPFTINYDKSCMCSATSNWFLTWWWFKDYCHCAWSDRKGSHWIGHVVSLGDPNDTAPRPRFLWLLKVAKSLSEGGVQGMNLLLNVCIVAKSRCFMIFFECTSSTHSLSQ